ncbi:MAG TPA: SDR family oxidoreductase [Chloroflexi bacterium]|jgi:nucleoside-diphosphate-sugar epimerase|nr:SDR family oxidoreductase [Chloroflexota bacterium]HPO57374.1 SDR family oxidoreductase [Anaerolineaceae bacterium]
MGDHPAAAPLALVTGGAGYVGSALLPRLLESGWRVRVLDCLLWGREPIARWLSDPRVELVEGDFRDEATVVRCLRGADAVVHLGGVVGDPACDLDERRTLEINVTATRLLAEAARRTGVSRFVFASTGAVYGACDRRMDEDAPLNPVSLYARSKIAGERILLEIAGEDFSPTILRFGTIFGLSGRARFDLVVNLLTAKALVDGRITVYGGNQWRSFVHVDDAARAVLAALQAPRELAHGQIYNTGSDTETYTILHIGELIARMVPQARLEVTPAQDASDYRIDCAKIAGQLGYHAVWTVARGVEQVRAALESGQVRDYTDERYSNVKYMAGSGRDRLPPLGEQWEEGLQERLERALGG